MAEQQTPGTSFVDRMFDALPLAPVSVSLALAAPLLGLILVTVWATGDLGELMEQDERLWQNRDARVVALLALLLACLPAVRRYQNQGTGENLEQLGSSLRWPPGEFEAATAPLQQIATKPQMRAGALGLLVIPVTALLVDRDPGLYFQRAYWGPGQFWSYALAIPVCFRMGVGIHVVLTQARCFSELARRVREVDLLDLGRFAPFARQGLRSALPGVLILSFFALNLVDRDWIVVSGSLGSVALAWMTASVLLPMRGAHERIREAKGAELARVNAMIRARLGRSGETREDPGSLGLADLLSYRNFVSALSEWPLDAPLRTRFLLYTLIPLGSWLGGAFVERILDAALS